MRLKGRRYKGSKEADHRRRSRREKNRETRDEPEEGKKEGEKEKERRGEEGRGGARRKPSRWERLSVP